MVARRRMLTVRISDEARAAIDAHCAKHGITITAWVEALGQRLGELRDASPEPALRAVSDETARIARQIDAERRARARDPSAT